MIGSQAAAANGESIAAGADASALLLSQADAQTPPPDILALEAIVNGQRSGNVIVHVGDDGMAIDEDSVRRWRVKVVPGSSREIDGRRYIPIAKLPGATATIEPRTQRLVVTLPAQLFEANVVVLNAQSELHLVPPPWSAFFNYDVFGFASRDTKYTSALFELGTSGPYGSGIAGAVMNSSKITGGNTGQTVLLDATWRYDDPAALHTTLFGNAISPAGAWGRSLRFGGVQYGTNFNLDPNLITYPLQAFPGTAVVPSTVDILVNGARISSQQVQPGPFTINNVPVVTGSGDVQLVVRDAFGQQQVITQPFYASRQLLKPGLDDYNISVGSERLNYGIESADYGSGFASGYWRRGLTDRVTIEFLAEGDNAARAGGATVDFMPGNYGVFSLGAAGSDGAAGSGYLGLVGYQYQDPRLSIGIRSLWASPNFRTPGDDFANPQQRLALANLGYNFGTPGTLGVAWVNQQNRGQQSESTTAISYTASLAANAFVNLSLSRSLGVNSQTSVFASIVFALDGVTSLSGDIAVTRSGGRTQTIGGATLQRALPIGEGWGYELRATTDRQYLASGSYAGPYGRYNLDIASQDGVNAARGSIAGGFGTLGGVVFASRPIIDSFGIVRVDGTPDVPVFQNGNLAGVTDRNGVVVMTQLFPYRDNRITIDDKRVPIDILLATREQQVAPYFRSGVIVDFGARKLVNATVAVLLPSGEPLPAGAEVRASEKGAPYPVGLDGEVFIADLVYGSTFTVDWAGGRCRFTVNQTQASAEPLPRLGPLRCVAVKE